MSLTADDLAVIQGMIDSATPTGEGFAVPIVAGQQLLIPGIESPNFSIAGQSGWAILQSGLAYFFSVVLSGGTITGTDWILNPSGFFQYSGTPSAANLAASWVPAACNDPFGTACPVGFCAVSAGTVAQIQAGSVGVGTLAQIAAGFNLGGISNTAAAAGRVALWSGQAASAVDAQAIIRAYSAGSTAGDRNIAAGATEIDLIAANVYLNGQLNLLAGNGPFVFQESWHNVTPPAGWTGLNRYKLLPWNCVLIDVQLTGSSSGNITCMALPAGYQPASNYSQPLAITTTAAALPTTLRMTIQSSGSVVTSGLPAPTTFFGGTWMIPLN